MELRPQISHVRPIESQGLLVLLGGLGSSEPGCSSRVNGGGQGRH